jgi:iron complex outermembrane recepter protein
MFKLLMVTVLVLLRAFLYAQDFSISGTISGNESDGDLAGATVQLEGTRYFAVSDEKGQFEIPRVKKGVYTLTAKFVGYHTLTQEVSVSGSVSLQLEMLEATTLTDEVVVYATRAGDKTPTTFTNVDEKVIQKQNFGQDLPFLLNWTPSLVTTSDGGAGVGYTGIRIRGSDATRINVTINGIPYNDSESQGTFWVDIPDVASSAQSIQIQRGVGTSTNGAGAFGASVNLQTSALKEDPYAEFTTSVGSYNTLRNVLKAGTGLINDHWAIDGRVSRIVSDGYIDRASSNLSSYFFSAGYYGKKTVIKGITFGGREQTYQAWYGIDEAMMQQNRRFNYAGAIYDDNWNVTRYYENEEDNYRQDHYQLHVSQKLNSYWTGNVSLHYTYGRGYYEQYQQDKPFAELGLNDILLTDGSTISSGDFIVRKWLDNHFYGTTYSFNYDKDKLNVVIGGGYNEYANARHFGEIIWAEYAGETNLGTKWYEGESKKTDFNIYARANYDLSDRLNAFADVQLRNVTYKTSGTLDDLTPYNLSDDLNFFNPKFGLTYSFASNNQVYGSYAVAHREPNRDDYLYNEVKPKAESLGNIEVGWRKTTALVNLELNYYLMNYTNQLVLTGQLTDVGNPIRANIGKSYRTGIEASASIHLTKTLNWNVNTTFSRNENVDYVSISENNDVEKKNTSIILSPAVIAGSQLAWAPAKHFQVALLAKYVGKQFLDNSESDHLALDAYHVEDLRLSYTIRFKGITAIETSLLINNLFDAKYASNGYTWGSTAYYYPQATRNFMAMVTVKF